MYDINCPYCKSENDINHDDGYGYGDNELYRQECKTCRKTFTYTTEIICCYYVDRADCLNGGEHKFEKTHTYPENLARFECIDCGEIKNV